MQLGKGHGASEGQALLEPGFVFYREADHDIRGQRQAWYGSACLGSQPGIGCRIVLAPHDAQHGVRAALQRHVQVWAESSVLPERQPVGLEILWLDTADTQTEPTRGTQDGGDE